MSPILHIIYSFLFSTVFVLSLAALVVGLHDRGGWDRRGGGQGQRGLRAYLQIQGRRNLLDLHALGFHQNLVSLTQFPHERFDGMLRIGALIGGTAKGNGHNQDIGGSKFQYFNSDYLRV